MDDSSCLIAIERALSSKLDDARDAIVNKLVDILGIYKSHVQGSAPGSTPQLTAPNNLKLLPLLALCLIKHVSFFLLFHRCSTN